LFPSPTGGDFFLLTLTQPGVESSWEIVKVTARSTDTLTVVRAQEGTSAAAWASGSKAELRLTAGVKWALGNIDQTISPTWTGNHTFAPASGNTVFSAGNVSIGGGTPQGVLDYNNNGATTELVFFLTSGAGNNTNAAAIRMGGASARGSLIRDVRGGSSNLHSLRIYSYNSTDVLCAEFTSSGNTALSGNLTLVDNKEIQVGTSTALRIYFDGTNSVIRNDTGALVVMSGATEAMRVTTGADLVVGDNSAVARISLRKNSSTTSFTGTAAPASVSGLYAANESSTTGAFCAITVTARNTTAELQTGSLIVQSVTGSNRPNIFLAGAANSAGTTQALLQITGATGNTDILLGHLRVVLDSKEVQLGASQDLRLFHDGTNSVIRNDTGKLQFMAGAIVGFDLDASAGVNVHAGIVVDGGNVVLSRAGSGTEVTAYVINSATAANSSSAIEIQVGGTAAGDPYLRFVVSGGSTWSVGAKNSSNDSLYFSPGLSLTTNPVLELAVNGSQVLGTRVALATNATDGFTYIPTCAGAPSGTPTAVTGKVPVVYDTTNNRLYAYNGAWKSVVFA
jgi:hypothetical protein